MISYGKRKQKAANGRGGKGRERRHSCLLSCLLRVLSVAYFSLLARSTPSLNTALAAPFLYSKIASCTFPSLLLSQQASLTRHHILSSCKMGPPLASHVKEASCYRTPSKSPAALAPAPLPQWCPPVRPSSCPSRHGLIPLCAFGGTGRHMGRTGEPTNDTTERWGGTRLRCLH